MERIAFLGLGSMGTPMARRLLAAGHPLTVWNRTASRAEPLRAEGAQVALSPAEAVLGTGIVVTMLAGPEALDAVAEEVLPALGAARCGPRCRRWAQTPWPPCASGFPKA